MSVETIKVKWREDGSATVLARMTARDATGNWTAVAGEGNWLKQADLSAITCAVFDLDHSTAPLTPVATPTVTISSAVQDTPVTDQKIWDLDEIGYNFVFDLAHTVFSTGGHRYRAEFLFVTTGGTRGWAVFEGAAEEVKTS